MRDKLRNPADHSDKELYTIHYRENTISDLYARCVKEGEEKWPLREASVDDEYDVARSEEFFELVRMNKGFKLSYRIYRDCKPFQIKTASRDQCLCIRVPSRGFAQLLEGTTRTNWYQVHVSPS